MSRGRDTRGGGGGAQPEPIRPASMLVTMTEVMVGGLPWAHIDIAGTGQAEASTRWIPKGPTAFGSRLLVELAEHFEPAT